MSGITLDAGGLIALERNDRKVMALLARAEALGMRVTIPATVLAQVMRNPGKQARLSRLIRQPGADVVVLDAADATGVGMLLAMSGTKDIVDAHVVLCALRTGQAVVSSDGGDLRRIASDVKVIAV
ncbi:MAG: PIN domain-containing protein [Acidobacteria bacterium]|nr:PIN domain-containing protein [Acidobacteriota bacterium]